MPFLSFPSWPSLQCFDTVGWGQEGHPVCKKTGCWFVGGDILTGALHVLPDPVVTTTSITLSSSKIRNGDILVPANPDPPGKWSLEQRERERDTLSPATIVGAVPELHILWWRIGMCDLALCCLMCLSWLSLLGNKFVLKIFTGIFVLVLYCYFAMT